MKIKAIITGASGMVGEGVLHECLINPNVEQVLVIGRKPCGHSHPKLKELIHNDFFNITTIKEQLLGYNACYFCAGVSSVGMNEAEYFRLTYEMTIHFATVLAQVCPELAFCYISGTGTDSTEKGKIMWTRVKGKTENDLMKLPFKNVFCFRPGVLTPTTGLKNTLSFYKYLGWLIPVIKIVFPGRITSLTQLGDAMINISLSGYSTQIIEVQDIKKLANRI